MRTNAGARVLLVVGFVAACIGYDAWLAGHVVLDPAATRAAAHAVLETPSVRRGLADELTKELDRQIPAAAKDPRVAPAVATAVRDPRVTAAFADTIARIHQAILTDGNRENFTIDGRAFTRALHDALTPTDPALAAQVARHAPLVVRVKTDKLPHLHDPRSTADVVALLGLVAALLLVTASLLVDHHRRSIARVGRRIAYLAVTPLVVFVVLPRLLEHVSGNAPQIASALLKVYGDRALPSAITLAVVGLAVVAGAFVWPRHRTSAAPASTSGAPRYTGPTPTPPRASPDQPSITEKMYL